MFSTELWTRSAVRRSLTLTLLAVGLPWPGSAQNILNNGGFESGLMCYDYYTISNSTGDFLFSLSPNSHSGNYAMQITCQLQSTGDCIYAAIYSNQIPATPGRQYNVSAWVNCPSGGGGALNIADNANQGASNNFTCTGGWTQYSQAFTVSPAASGFIFYVYDEGNQTMLIDDVTVTYGDGTAPSRITLHPGVRPVAISGQNVLVDGAPYLALGFFDVPLADISLVRATGANTIHGASQTDGGSPADCFNTGTESYEDTIYDAGMTFIPDSGSTAHMNNPAVFPPMIQNFAPHLANIAWFVADEPDLDQWGDPAIDPAILLAESNAIRGATSLPVLADMQHAAYDIASYDAAYAPAVDFWMAEPYGPNFGSLQYATNLLTSLAPRPIWLAQDDIDAGLIVPKAYWAVVNGATGIFYFKWPTFKGEPDKLAAATQAFGELNTLKSAIFSSPMDDLVTPPAGIATMSRFSDGTAYVLAVNPNPVAVQGKFSVQGIAAGQQVSVLFENRSLTAAAGGFTDSFAGVGRHVYAITSATTSLVAGIAAKSGTAAARTWSVQLLDDGPAAANGANIAGVKVTRTGGTVCTPQVVPGTLPLAFGNLVPGMVATGNLSMDFTGCDSTSKFAVAISLSANSGATTATYTSVNQRY